MLNNILNDISIDGTITNMATYLYIRNRMSSFEFFSDFKYCETDFMNLILAHNSTEVFFYLLFSLLSWLCLPGFIFKTLMFAKSCFNSCLLLITVCPRGKIIYMRSIVLIGKLILLELGKIGGKLYSSYDIIHKI